MPKWLDFLIKHTRAWPANQVCRWLESGNKSSVSVLAAAVHLITWGGAFRNKVAWHLIKYNVWSGVSVSLLLASCIFRVLHGLEAAWKNSEKEGNEEEEKEWERARQSDKAASCPCIVNRVCSVRPLPWRPRHRPDKNATGHRPPSPLPSLSAPLACYIPSPSYLFSRFTLRTRTRPPSSLITQIKPPTSLSSSQSESAAVLLIQALLSPSSWGSLTPGGFMNDLISAMQTTPCTPRHRSSFGKGLRLCAHVQVCVSLHNGVTNWLFCSNNNLSQWFSTPIWLITMPTLAWHPHNFLRLAENHMRHDYALLG